MDFDYSAKTKKFIAQVKAFMDAHIYPNEARYYRELAHRPSFANVIANARPYRHLFPLPWPADFDRYHQGP